MIVPGLGMTAHNVKYLCARWAAITEEPAAAQIRAWDAILAGQGISAERLLTAPLAV